MASKIMHMVTDTQYTADGATVTYGAGELHDPDTLPAGVPYREVIASAEFAATAPGHAGGAAAAPAPPPPPAPAPAKAKT